MLNESRIHAITRCFILLHTSTNVYDSEEDSLSFFVWTIHLLGKMPRVCGVTYKHVTLFVNFRYYVFLWFYVLRSLVVLRFTLCGHFTCCVVWWLYVLHCLMILRSITLFYIKCYVVRLHYLLCYVMFLLYVLRCLVTLCVSDTLFADFTSVMIRRHGFFGDKNLWHLSSS